MLSASNNLLLSDSSVLLMSPWKPIIFWGAFIAWGWLVSAKLDKDARYFNLNWKRWNALFLGSGVIAAVVMFTGWIFWVSLPAGILILLIPVLIYWRVRNAAVPEGRQYHLSFSRDQADRLQQKQVKAREAAAIKFSDLRGQDVKVPGKDDPAFKIYLQAEDILGPAVKSRASRINMLLTDSGCRLGWVIDGLQKKLEDLSTEDGVHVVNFMKEMAGMDLSDTRRKRTSSFSMLGHAGETQVQITTSGSSKGQIIVLEFDREQSRLIPYDMIGLIPQQREYLDQLASPHERHGIVLITSPPSSGMTTAGYSLLGRHDAYTCNIKTLEYDVQAYVNGVDQVEWDSMNVEVDFATNLQSILRRDPDIVLIDDVRDSETAKIAVAPGRQGPLIYITMHSLTTVSAIREWVKRVGDVDEAIKPVRAVMNQRLLRKVCPNCRQPLSKEEIESIQLPRGVEQDFYRAVGQIQHRNKVAECPVCNGTGYLGQTAVFEVFQVDKEIRNHLRGGDLKTAISTARRNRMLLLQEAALWKAGHGETSIEEIARVFTPKARSSVKKPNKAEASP